MVARNALPAAGSLAISTGGVPARRAYLRFVLPQWLLDSTSIVRATLLVTQVPTRGFDQNDSVTAVGQAVAATNLISDLYRSSQILLPAGLFVTDSMRMAPADSGVRTMELNTLVTALPGRVRDPGLLDGLLDGAHRVANHIEQFHSYEETTVR